MDKVSFNVLYNRKKRLLANGTALVQIEAYLRGKKKYFSTKIYLTPDQWDNKHRRVKNHPNQVRLNKQIKDFVSELESVELKQIQNGKPFFLEFLSEYLKGNCSNLFIPFCEQELKKLKLKKRTQENHTYTIRHLKKFSDGITFENVDFNFLQNFELYLIGEGLQTNTIFKHFSIIKRYVNLAIDKELFDLNKYPFRKFKPKRKETHRNYLTPEEIVKIESLVLPPEKKNLQLSLDKFLFAVYTGLRYSDMSALKSSDLKIVDGKEWLHIEMQKTGEPLKIPISMLFDAKPLELFYKYASGAPSVFPHQDNYTVNKHLTDIAELARIDKTITYHVGRHTQATYLLYKGVPITTVQKLLGHKRLETTQIYGKVMDQTIVNELQKVSFK